MPSLDDGLLSAWRNERKIEPAELPMRNIFSDALHET